LKKLLDNCGNCILPYEIQRAFVYHLAQYIVFCISTTFFIQKHLMSFMQQTQELHYAGNYFFDTLNCTSFMNEMLGRLHKIELA